MTTPRPVYVGIDGGGTKTDLAMVDADGMLLARIQGETSNKSIVGTENAVTVLTALIDSASADAGVETPITSGWIGMAGTDRPEDQAAFNEALGSRFTDLRITNDAELVLSGTEDGTGIALIAGTGSIAFARNVQGMSGRSGGWGHIFGDEGSAYTLALDGLRAVAAAADGRGPETELTGELLAWWGVDRPHQLIPKVYDASVKKADIAASAPMVVRSATAGDAVAGAILDRASEALADLVTSLARRIPFATPPTVAGTGGLLLHTSSVRDRLAKLIDPALVRPEIQLVDDIAVSTAQAVRRFSMKGQS